MKKLPTILLLTFLVTAPTISAADWPHLRGPEVDGRLVAPGTFEAGDLGLHLAWRAPLGSGYSGVALADGLAVTLFTDGAADWVVALDATSGKEKWRHEIGTATKGHDGSDDGPLSSPTIAGGTVYAIGAQGRLLALKLVDGSPVWSKMLERDFGAEPPHFGFTTTPLVVGNVLVVQTGGAEGRSVCGLDRKNGKLLWSHGDAGVSYQSPAVMTLGGRRQVVAVSSGRIDGIDPKDGKVLWTHELGEDDNASSANPTFMDDYRFLVSISGQIAVFRVSTKDGFAVEELYRTRELGGTYSPPVYHDGHLYGFRREFLTCVKAASGEQVWRSRPPGGKGLILVDKKLVIFGAKGNVVIAEATPAGYQERTRFQALEGSGLTWPSFAYGRIYVRNLNEIAAVNVTEGATVASIPRMEIGDHAFARWVKRVEAADAKQPLIDEFLSEHEHWPIVEGEYVHFLYRGGAKDVAIAGSMLDSGSAEPMHPIGGTDLYHRSFRLEPGGRWEYRFQIDFDEWVQDDRNPRKVPAVEDDHGFSEVATPGYEIGSFLDEPESPRGRLDTFTLTSEILGYDKEIRVWLPPGYDDSGRSYPLLVVNDGGAWLDKGLMANTLENLVGRRVVPVVVAFVDAAGRWWLEAGGSRTDDYVRMQGEELLPALKERYRLVEDRGAHGIMGHRFYGMSTAYAVLKYPDIFGKAAMQSVYISLGTEDALTQLAREHVGSPVRFYLDWNRYDERDIDSDFSMSEESRRLAEILRKNGYKLTGGEVLDSHGWGGWRNRNDRMLVSLFPGS